MPVYEYNCEECGPFTKLRGIDQSSQPAHCPECGVSSSRIFSVIHLRAMRPKNRIAWERNERSAHAPHVCGSGCSHARVTTKNRISGDQPAMQASTKRNSRPWMLGH